MRQQGLLITALAGLASAALFMAAPTSALMAILQVFTQLPLLFAGLSLGVKPALWATGLAGLLVLLFASSISLLVFVLATALPCLILIRQTMLSRTNENGQTEWYPIGWVVAQLGLYFMVVFALVVVGLESQSIDVAAAVNEVFQDVTEGFAGPQGQAFDPELIESFAKFVPALTAVGLFVTTIINAVIAQALAARSGQAQRPTPSLAAFSLPGWAILLLGAATLATIILSGTLFMVAAAAMLLTMTLFFFQGTAVVHAYLKPKSWRGPGLFLFYLMIIFLGWVAFIVVVLGLIDDRLHLRQRFS